ncbi:MAG TPA: hypothetical protein VGK99_23345 [Acidobacteriota bacterium]
MRPRIAAAVLVLLFCTSVAFAQTDAAVPQVADGQFIGGSFRTTFIVFNTGTVSAVVTIILTQDNAAPMQVTIPELGTNSTFSFTLGPGETRILQTNGSGAVTTGAARIQSNQNITVSAIFTLFGGDGSFVTEAGVGSSVTLTDFVLPVDATGTFNTGLALFNPGTGTATILLRLINASGQETARITITLAAGAHIAKFVAGAGEFFPSVSNFRGTLAVSSNVPIAAVTLRQNSNPITFTTLPVVARAITQLLFNLPQAANGVFAGGSFRTSFLIFNISLTPATVTLTLTRDDGTPFSVTIPGRGTAATFTLTLQPGESVILQTDGTGPLSAGAARVTSNVPIGVSAIFTTFAPDGRFITEAGVGDSPALTEFTLAVDTTGKFNTGVAFFVPGDESTTLTFRLFDRNGAAVGPAQTRTLASHQHLALFVTELIAGLQNFRGSLSITASRPTSALTLRQNSDPLTFTTVPVGRGAFVGGGTPQPAALLRRVFSNVTATSDQVLNATLPPGFRLSGTVNGPIQGFVVFAVDGNNIFVSTVNPATKRYLIIVPAATYSLLVCYTPQGIPTTTSTTLAFEDPSAVTVTADTTRDINIGAVPLFQVSGTVQGFSSIPSLTSPTVVFTSMDFKTGAIFPIASDGQYQGQLPGGSYRVSFTGSAQLGPLQFQGMTVYNIGTLTIASAATANFTVPATARLSGSLSNMEQFGPGAFSLMSAADLSIGTLPVSLVCNFPPYITSVLADPFSNTYQMILTAGRTHQLNVIAPINEGEMQAGVFTFPQPGEQLTINGDTTRNFAAPMLPPRVIFTGRVTDNAGQGVAKVSVSATSSQLTGGISATYSGFTQTDNSGNYRLVLLSGTNYTITFQPTPPQP